MADKFAREPSRCLVRPRDTRLLFVAGSLYKIMRLQHEKALYESSSGALASGLVGAQVSAAEPNEMFIIHDVADPPEVMVEKIKDYVLWHEDWIFLADFGLKGGEVTAVKICYLPLGSHIFAAGMHVAAMMPCGHIALYEEDGTTRLSMLNLEFMTALNPDPNLEKAVEIGTTAFESMLEEVLN